MHRLSELQASGLESQLVPGLAFNASGRRPIWAKFGRSAVSAATVGASLAFTSKLIIIVTDTATVAFIFIVGAVVAPTGALHTSSILGWSVAVAALQPFGRWLRWYSDTGHKSINLPTKESAANIEMYIELGMIKNNLGTPNCYCEEVASKWRPGVCAYRITSISVRSAGLTVRNRTHSSFV